MSPVWNEAAVTPPVNKSQLTSATASPATSSSSLRELFHLLFYCIYYFKSNIFILKIAQELAVCFNRPHSCWWSRNRLTAAVTASSCCRTVDPSIIWCELACTLTENIHYLSRTRPTVAPVGPTVAVKHGEKVFWMEISR